MGMTTDQQTLARLYLADPGTTAVQQLQIENATGGSFTLTFSGQTTSAIPYPAMAGDVQNALAALTNIGLGGVNVIENIGVPNSTFFVIYFAGTLSSAAQPVITIDATSLVGAGVTVSIVQTVAGGVTVFSGAELDAFYADANQLFGLAIALAFDTLWANASKFNDYTVGQTNEKKSQIAEHLKELAAWWHQWANASQQVQFAKMQSVPPRLTAVPVISGVPAVGLTYAPPFGPRSWPNRRGPF